MMSNLTTTRRNIMEFRKATKNDIDFFTQNRIDFITSIRKIDNLETFEHNTRTYLEQNIETNNLFIYLALENQRIISSCMACVTRTAPRPSSLNGISAELLNVYTLESYRRNGYAEKLLNMLFSELKDNQVEKILLDYTDMGLPLYQKLGFVSLEKQMQLKL